MAKKIFNIILSLLTIAIIGFMFYLATIVKVKNPSGHDIIVKIDDMTLIIKKREEAKITLYPGKHTVTLGKKTVGDFEKGYFDMGSFINPTKATYLMEYQTYYDEGTDRSVNPLPNNTVTINHKKYTGPYTVHNDLYMQNDFVKLSADSHGWDFDETEQFPSTITVRENSMYTWIKHMLGFNYEVKRKLSLIR